ncbi:hypothetical protein E4U55_004327 [Claviceps digitariae]|nr:hypothetical protein E4U55_004327 [Claviceps digitariae]
MFTGRIRALLFPKWPIIHNTLSSGIPYVTSSVDARRAPLDNISSRSSASEKRTKGTNDEEVDVLIVGAGGAGLTAALRSRFYGLQTLVIEKNDKLGGSSAYSGAGLWVPQNPLAEVAGILDSKDDALMYMENVIGDGAGPASSRSRKVTYLEQGPQMVRFLQTLGFNWRLSRGCPDYYPTLPGAMPHFGRTIEPGIFDLNQINNWQSLLRARPRQPPPLFTDEASSITRMGSTVRDFGTVIKVMCRSIWLKLLGQAPATMGQSLIGQLIHLGQRSDVPIWRNARLVEIMNREDGTVVGASVRIGNEDDSGLRRIHVRRGVLLCAGGFAHNREMRTRYGPSPASTEWTSTPEGDTGDAILAGMKLDAATALMDDAWWGPTILDPVMGKYYFALQERARPFSIIVDSSGSRFMNESGSYTDCGKQQYARNHDVQAIPAWLVLDANHRKRYSLGTLMPRQEPKVGLEAGWIHRADTLSELASRIRVSPTMLEATISRFNGMARAGVDVDFGRGGNVFENYFGDPQVQPNPNLGPIAVPPFYAVPIVPGDLGTKGGLVTDEHARVLRPDGTVIKGLYATGNTTASIMGRTYPGAGSTLGPALTFGYIAVNHMAGDDDLS